MGCVCKHTFRTTFFQCFRSFAQRAPGIDHIVNQYTVTTGNITDDMHHLRNVRTRATFVDDSHISVVQQFGDRTGTDHTTDIRRNHNRVVQIFLQHIFQQNWAAEDVINRDIEEALNLLSVKIHCQHTVNTHT